jgi:hypothetical protein
MRITGGEVGIAEVPVGLDAAALAQHEGEGGGGIGRLCGELDAGEPCSRLGRPTVTVVVQSRNGNAPSTAERRARGRVSETRIPIAARVPNKPRRRANQRLQHFPSLRLLRFAGLGRDRVQHCQNTSSE